MAIVHLPGCKICIIAFCLFSTLESDYIQWHKFNMSGTPPANKATQICSCTVDSSICTIYKGRSGKGSSLTDQEKVLSEEKAVVSSSLPHMSLFEVYNASWQREAITVVNSGVYC